MVNSDHVAVLVSINFPLNSKQEAPFHRIAYDYSHADLDGLCDHLRDDMWDYIFKLSASTAANEFYEWFQFEIDLYSPHFRYQVKYHYHGFQQPVKIAHRNHLMFVATEQTF